MLFGHFQMKILVPNSTAGMIIGRQGSYIKEISTETGAFIEVSKKSGDSRIPERVITIIGNPDQIIGASEFMIRKIADDANSGQYPSVSYKDIAGNLTFDSSSRGGGDGGGRGGGGRHGNDFGQAFQDSAYGGGSVGGGRSISPAPRIPYENPIVGLGGGSSWMGRLASCTSVGQFLDSLHLALRQGGYGDLACTEITAAMQTLAKYNVLGLVQTLHNFTAINQQSSVDRFGGYDGGFDRFGREGSVGRGELGVGGGSWGPIGKLVIFQKNT